MGQEQLVQRLERDADARIAAATGRADAEQRALSDAAASASEQASRDALGARRDGLRATLEREVVAARRRARQATLRAEHAVVERVMARALELSADAERDPAFVARMMQDLATAMSYLEGRPATLRCRPSLAAAAGEHPDPSLTVEPTGEMGPGFVLAARDGTLTVDGTMAARLLAERADLAIAILAELRS